MYRKLFNGFSHILDKIFLLCLFLCIAFTAHAQDEERFKPIHSIGFSIGHEHSFHGVDENGKRQVIVLPCWGLDYVFQFSPKFGVGLLTDFITEAFKVEKNLESGHKEVIERSYPIAPAVMGFYKINRHWSCGLGFGGEFTKEENFFLSRAGVEYGVPIKNGWDVFGTVQYDFRWNAYDTWAVGMGLIKSFGRKEHQQK